MNIIGRSSYTVGLVRSDLHGLSDLQHVIFHPLVVLRLEYSQQYRSVIVIDGELTDLPVPHLLDLPEPPLPLLQLPLLPQPPLLDGFPPGPRAVLPLCIERLVAPVTEVVSLVFVQTPSCHLVTAASHLNPAER